MKKFFEKHDLFKLAGVVALIAILLTWLVSYSYYSSGSLVTDEISRFGIFDFTTYSQLPFYYFTVYFMFVFVVGGFYKFLASLDAYDILTTRIAKRLKGKEKIFVAVIILILACLAGVSTEYLALFAIIPFVISILSKMKLDKVTGLASTFGGVLVGILGATYSSKINGVLVSTSTGIGVSYGYELVAVIIVFAIAYLLLTYFTLLRMSKISNKKITAELLVDPFAPKVEVKEEKVVAEVDSNEKVTAKKVSTKKSTTKKSASAKKSTTAKKVAKKSSTRKTANASNDTDKIVAKRHVSTLGLSIMLAVTFVVIGLAFVDWEGVFNITIFADAYDYLTEASVMGYTIFQYILGTYVSEFGGWDLLTASGALMIAAFIIKLIYHVPFDKMLDEFAEGFKKINKSILILMVIYLVLEVSVIFPTVPALVDKILSLGTNFGTLFVSALLTHVFTVDFQYTASLIGSVYANFSKLTVAALILQFSYGIVSFIAPTSVMLMLGLSVLDIKFKDYLKFIWKFLLAILVVTLIVIAILMYI